MPQSLRTRVAYQPQVGDWIIRVRGASSLDIELLTILGLTGGRIQVKYYWPFDPNFGPLVVPLEPDEWTRIARRAHKVEERP